MTIKISKIPTKKKLEKCLEDYKNITSLCFDNTRRTIWPLYDFYFNLLRLAALKFFDIDAIVFVKYPPNILSRWNLIKDCIEEISPDDANLEKYNGIIIMVQKFSNNVRHEDDFVPPKNRLDDIHQDAMKFYEWLSSQGEKFVISTKKEEIMEKIEKRERFGKEEWVIKSKGICPKCGKNTSMIISYSDKGDKTPKIVIIRIECEDCSYIIDTEVILLSEYCNDTR